MIAKGPPRATLGGNNLWKKKNHKLMLNFFVYFATSRMLIKIMKVAHTTTVYEN